MYEEDYAALGTKPGYCHHCHTGRCPVSITTQDPELEKRLDVEQGARRVGLTYFFVSHDFGVIRYVSDRVAVMYLGRMVETDSSEAIFTRPQHADTKALLDAVPDVDPAKFRAAAKPSA